MRIKVTGSSGFIGSWLCHTLSIPEFDQYDLLKNESLDVTREEIQREIVKDADVIVHLAARSGLKQCEEDLNQAYLHNSKAVHWLAHLAKAAGVKRFILASSASVYGEIKEYLITENHPTQPRSIYGQTKLDAERILELASDSFEVVILRKSNVYGWGTRWKGTTVIDAFLNQYLSKKPFQIAGDGSQKRDFVHIQDVVNLYSKIASSEKVHSGIYNVGGPETISMRGLAELINDLGEVVFGYRNTYEFKDKEAGVLWHDFKYDHSKARMEFQYLPRFTLDDAIKERLWHERRTLKVSI